MDFEVVDALELSCGKLDIPRGWLHSLQDFASVVVVTCVPSEPSMFPRALYVIESASQTATQSTSCKRPSAMSWTVDVPDGGTVEVVAQGFSQADDVDTANVFFDKLRERFRGLTRHETVELGWLCRRANVFLRISRPAQRHTSVPVTVDLDWQGLRWSVLSNVRVAEMPIEAYQQQAVCSMTTPLASHEGCLFAGGEVATSAARRRYSADGHSIVVILPRLGATHVAVVATPQAEVVLDGDASFTHIPQALWSTSSRTATVALIRVADLWLAHDPRTTLLAVPRRQCTDRLVSVRVVQHLGNSAPFLFREVRDCRSLSSFSDFAKSEVEATARRCHPRDAIEAHSVIVSTSCRENEFRIIASLKSSGEVLCTTVVKPLDAGRFLVCTVPGSPSTWPTNTFVVAAS